MIKSGDGGSSVPFERGKSVTQYTGTNAQEFIDEAKKIIENAKKHGVSLRLIGALAFHLRCPEFNFIHDRWGRVFTDTDCVARSEDGPVIIEVYRELGYQDDEMITTLYGEKRLVFDHPETGFHSDIFFDCLDFCHVLPLRERLDIDELTIPLADLFLEKMQIVEINAKDIVDTIMLVREHPVGEADEGLINAPLIGDVLASEWGFWRTVTGNVEKVKVTLEEADFLEEGDKEIVRKRLKQIEEYVDNTPKPMAWKLRSKIGDKMKWYKDVDELG